MNAEDVKMIQAAAKAAFVEQLKADGATNVPFGGSIMPRAEWARCLTFALVATGCAMVEDADKIAAVLGCELGNSSQLGMLLVKEGTITVGTAATAAASLSDQLAARLAAKAAPAS